MTRVDMLGDRFCVAVSWMGFFYILYWHLAR
jgi:hypothetical protein